MHPQFTICSVPGCERPAAAQALCSAHWQRWRKGNLHPEIPLRRSPLTVRFWAKVNKDGPIIRPELGRCWFWTDRLDQEGYGHLKVSGCQVLAHRIAWQLAGHELGDLDVLHKCDNPPCVREEHLFEGTHADNMADMVAKGRTGSLQHPERVPRGEQHWNAKLTEANVLDMRAKRSAGATYAALGCEYGVAIMTAWTVCNSGWKGVE